MDCIFCKILDGEIPAELVYEDERIVAFNDINPRAPLHQLIIPRKHIATVNDITADDKILVGHMVHTAARLAKDAGIADDGYRTVFNCNKGAGQEVYHIHLHLLGGRSLTWPPG